MFDFDVSKLMVIGVVALIFIPAKDLPRALQQLGRLVGKIRRSANEFQSQFMDAMKEADVDGVRKDIENAARLDVSFDPVRDIRDQVTSAVNGVSEPHKSVSFVDGLATHDSALSAPHDPARVDTQAGTLVEAPGAVLSTDMSALSSHSGEDRAQAVDLHEAVSAPSFERVSHALPPEMPEGGAAEPKQAPEESMRSSDSASEGASTAIKTASHPL